MSRIIIKNLPKAITDAKLREIFGEKGLITDVQLKYTPKGKFRQFAFIGFQNESDGDEAIKHFNKTRINTSQIVVEKCALLGDQSKPQSWSKYAADSNVNAKKREKIQNNEKKVEKKVKNVKDKENPSLELLNKYKDDPLFEQFLQVHDAKDAQNLVQKNRETVVDKDSGHEGEPADSEKEEIEATESESKIANEKISDFQYMKLLAAKTPRKKMEKKVKPKIVLYNVKLRNLPYNCKKKDIKHFFKPLVPYTIRLSREIKSIAYAGFKDEKEFQKALFKDKSIIKGKQISVAKYNSKFNPNDDKTNSVNPKWKSQEESLKNEEDIAESGRIFIRNLSYTTVEDDLQKLFEKFGLISDLTLPIDTTTRKMKGFGVVTFVMPEHAVKAYAELDGTILHGRMLHLLPGKLKDKAEDDGNESSNFKQKKNKKLKSQAGSSHNWNSLFLGHDAVAEVIASTYNTTKEAVLAPHGEGSAAVRLALGETQIVATTRKYLEDEGVYLDAFDGVSVKRSKTVILVKNLPAGTKMKEIRDMFQVHGILGRVIFPPSGITAIVEFLEPSEAKKAFTKLAYTKFKNMPLYLEWAPENGLQAKPITNTEIAKPSVNAEATEESKFETNEPEEEPEENTTLFVKNLNFTTTDEVLKKHFESCGKIFYANVATKKDKDNPMNKLSMGYGFVRFLHKSSADKALKTLQQSTLEDKSLELKRSERALANDVKTARKTTKSTKQTGTKILVRNIPFQANQKEVMELFKTFGEIKALRLPKKMATGTDSHRGFAFVDFTTNSNAKKAFEALSQSTHLYGRRLVLEWAANEEGVDEIRKRTAEHFHKDTEVKASKRAVIEFENL